MPSCCFSFLDTKLYSILIFGEKYVQINNNKPYFDENDYTTKVYENYSELDDKGRCGVASANICKETMPAQGEKRGDISSIKPSGWRQKKYNGEFLYNRCHLIGYQLTGENANENNLITCTRNTNTSTMLDMENKVTSLNSQLKKYRSTTVTYTFGSETVVLDADTISSWLKAEGETLTLDEDAIKTYISDLANKYNTIYVPRTFHTSTGTDVTIEGNEYGYRIDQDGEYAQLVEDLKSGTAVTRDPVYSKTGYQRNGTDDLAGSYIEVSLDAQHLWLYKDGNLVTETDIVSGKPVKGRETYRGAWPIAYKASPFNLTSAEYGYDVKVNYWMPFVYGQGLHDASWQSSFGGNRYKTNGSHGCINLPKDQAALIYETIDAGYPIIIY